MIRGLPWVLLAVWALALPLASAAQDARFPAAIEAEFASAKESMMDDQAKTLRHVAAAQRLAATIRDTRLRQTGLATARWLAAEANLRSGKAENAGPLLREGLKIIAGIAEPIKLRGDLLMSQGAYYTEREEAAKALESFQKAYQVFAQVKEPRSQAMALQNIGALYSSANDDVRAERYYRQAAAAFGGDPMLSLSIHNRRGNVLMTLERYREAEAEYMAALAIVRGMDKPLLEARILANLARNQVEGGELQAADRTIQRGFTLTRGADALSLRRSLLATAARLSADRGDDVQAGSQIRESFAGLDLATTPLEYRTAHLYAYRIFARTGDLKLALAHLEALRRLNEEAAKVATTAGAGLMAARFDFARQEAQIANLKRAEAERTAEYQRTLFFILGGAGLVLIAMLTLGLITLRRSRNQVRAANVVLNQTNQALEKALAAKTEFLATTSHEIRTPLNGILGMTQVMLADPALAGEMRDRLGVVHGAGVTMRALVDDILDVAKMETGNLTVDPAPMDLCATLQEVTRLWEEQARANGLAFRLELTHAPQWIVSDAGRLRQIVFNLLSNAVKFTEKGSVSVRAVAEGAGDDRHLRLIVADTGVGIPADKFEQVFESFRQVDASTTRKFGGTGLGLTICRNLARALGGDIVVESTPGAGSRFIVELPLVTAEMPVESTESVAGASMLILDRNPIARSMLRTLFEPRVASLRFVGTVEEALAACADGSVEALLADEATLKMGEGDPIAALRALIAAVPGAATTVLWSQPGAEVQAQLMATGIGQIIQKPIGGADLIRAVIPPIDEKTTVPTVDTLVSQAA